MIPIKNKDIRYTTEKYILQQCNCLTVTARGLAQVLADYFPHGNAYEDRQPIGKRNLAIKNDRPEPGSVNILEGDDQYPYIICLHGQYRPGKTNSRYSYPTDYPDTSFDRLQYFNDGLQDLLNYFGHECPIIAVPYKIGCGLAGGNWKNYLELLENFHIMLKKNGGGLVLYKFVCR